MSVERRLDQWLGTFAVTLSYRRMSRFSWFSSVRSRLVTQQIEVDMLRALVGVALASVSASTQIHNPTTDATAGHDDSLVGCVPDPTIAVDGGLR